MKRKTVLELICPWLQVQYPTLGSRQADLYAKVSCVKVYTWDLKFWICAYTPGIVSADYLPVAH